jgi:Flp pilus assembly protein protease CpaA
MFTASEKCGVPNQLLIGLLITASFIFMAMITTGVLSRSQTAAAASFIIIFAVFGLVGMLKDISILRCPNRVLVGGAVFVIATSLLARILHEFMRISLNILFSQGIVFTRPVSVITGK